MIKNISLKIDEFNLSHLHEDDKEVEYRFVQEAVITYIKHIKIVNETQPEGFEMSQYFRMDPQNILMRSGFT